MSSPQHPLFDPLPPEAGLPSAPSEQISTVKPASVEDPPWSGWEVLQIAVVTILSVIAFQVLTAFVVQRLLFSTRPISEVGAYPLVTVLAQLLAYAIALIFMVLIIRRHPGLSFFTAIRWNWPPGWPVYVISGVTLSIGLQVFAHFLPIPKEVPMDRFFQTAREAWVLSLLGMTLVPLMEELFFRGFLYPVLARRIHVVPAVTLTAFLFSLIHAPQLGRAWAPVLVIFIVGLALTATRAATRSVAAGLLVHSAYNATIFVLMFMGTDGFRHMEKLSQ